METKAFRNGAADGILGCPERNPHPPHTFNWQEYNMGFIKGRLVMKEIAA